MIFHLYAMNKRNVIRSLLIDDNAFNTEVLFDLLQEVDEPVEVIAKATNGKEALDLIKRHQPDLIFLDVEMPDMNGFEVLGHLDQIDFQTIFVTAHSHYAIKAIRLNALDYLVKPIVPKELKAALKRFRSQDYRQLNQSQVQQALANLQEQNRQNQVLFLPTQDGGMKLVLRDIVKIVGERNYSTIHLSTGKTKLSSKTLGYFEEVLEEQVFLRCHRSYLVNRHHIVEWRKEAFLLKDDTQIPISRRKKSEARAWFDLQ